MTDLARAVPAAALVRRISRSTDRLNRDNISRTRAYQAFWQRHPDVHWALLAAFVSRNAGYFMTDLKSGRYPGPVRASRKERTFQALERSNWLIFRDAFPQLLLYDLSVRQRQDCFGLMSQVTRSAHMTGFWRDFARSGNSDRLTRSLIANEQAYVERRILRDVRYRPIFRSPGYRAMEAFGRLSILLPPSDAMLRFPIRRFAGLEDRVRLGCRIYRGLFPDGRLHPRIADWLAAGIAHSGSRADYSPERFAPVATARRTYSPPLRTAWAVVRHEADHDVEEDFSAALAAARLAPIDLGDGDGNTAADLPLERWISDPAGAG